MNKKEARVVELRLMGRTYEEIAKECGYRSASGAWQACQRARVEIIIEPLEELRHLELMRLDDALLSISDRAFSGDLPAINMMLKIMDRRAKLLGLDKAAKASTNGWAEYTTEELDVEIEKVEEIFNGFERDFLAKKEKELRMKIQREMSLEKQATSNSHVKEVGPLVQGFLNSNVDVKGESPSEMDA